MALHDNVTLHSRPHTRQRALLLAPTAHHHRRALALTRGVAPSKAMERGNALMLALCTPVKHRHGLVAAARLLLHIVGLRTRSAAEARGADTSLWLHLGHGVCVMGESAHWSLPPMTSALSRGERCGAQGLAARTFGPLGREHSRVHEGPFQVLAVPARAIFNAGERPPRGATAHLHTRQQNSVDVSPCVPRFATASSSEPSLGQKRMLNCEIVCLNSRTQQVQTWNLPPQVWHRQRATLQTHQVRSLALAIKSPRSPGPPAAAVAAAAPPFCLPATRAATDARPSVCSSPSSAARQRALAQRTWNAPTSTHCQLAGRRQRLACASNRSPDPTPAEPWVSHVSERGTQHGSAARAQTYLRRRGSPRQLRRRGPAPPARRRAPGT